MGGLAARVASSHPRVRSVRVDTAPYVEAGASETQELAVMLATGAAYLRAMSDAGMTSTTPVAQIEVSLAADADVFTTVAKLRAARRVWSAMTAACGATSDAQAPQLHVRTADRMMTVRDPWVNLLRVTAAALGAGLGGARSVTTAAFDSELGEPEELGRRMARNTQLLLQEESNVGRVVDPAGGSWYVESLTDQIAVAAWEQFGQIEAGGAMAGVLLDGTLASSIAEVRDARLAKVATRERGHHRRERVRRHRRGAAHPTGARSAHAAIAGPRVGHRWGQLRHADRVRPAAPGPVGPGVRSAA